MTRPQQGRQEMLIPSKLHVARQPVIWIFALLILIATPFASRSYAQDSGVKDRIYVVTHVDTLPGNGPAAKLLQQYVAESRKDKGVVRIELYVQISRAN